MKYHLTLVRMAIIKLSTNNKRWGGCGEKGILLYCWWKYKLVQSLEKTVWSYLKNLKIELPYDPPIPLLGIYPERTTIPKDTCTPKFTEALFSIAKTWKQPKRPFIEERIKEMWYKYTVQYYSTLERNKIMPFAAIRVDLEIIILNEVRQRQISCESLTRGNF